MCQKISVDTFADYSTFSVETKNTNFFTVKIKEYVKITKQNVAHTYTKSNIELYFVVRQLKHTWWFKRNTKKKKIKLKKIKGIRKKSKEK